MKKIAIGIMRFLEEIHRTLGLIVIVAYNYPEMNWPVVWAWTCYCALVELVHKDNEYHELYKELFWKEHKLNEEIKHLKQLIGGGTLS